MSQSNPRIVQKTKLEEYEGTAMPIGEETLIIEDGQLVIYSPCKQLLYHGMDITLEDLSRGDVVDEASFGNGSHANLLR